ncbi:MAG: type I-C CRISPR-associated protein Cas8c/Csd1 [Gammaproteobacteria bacterium]|nr:type I-C CRISPR-associated protein Cas8c/Csd1 [Gammaproteobacteria bacterium]
MLNALVEYAERQLPNSEPGFRSREVRWSVELAGNGGFLGVVPLGDGKRGQDQIRCPDMHGMNAGGKSHFLVETAQTVGLLFKPNEDPKKIAGTKVKHQFFADMLCMAGTTIPTLSVLSSVLVDEERLAQIRDALSEQKAKPTDWIGWRIDGADPRENPDVQNWWREWRRTDLVDSATAENGDSEVGGDGEMLCLLTGESVAPLPTHPKIIGLSSVGGLGTGDVMVGFDKASFGSYGLDQSANAAMGAGATQKYVDSLNDLIRNHSYKLGHSLVAHWFKQQVAQKDDPLEWLNGFEPQESTEASALASAKRLLSSIRNGKRADLGNNYYYALTISGASGRVMVRDWMDGRFEDLLRNVEAWFSDLEITKWDGQGVAFDPKFYEVCLALIRNDRSKSIWKNLEQLPAPTAASLWKAAVRGLSIPQSIMAQALGRFRAERFHPNDQKREVFDHARMGLIKAYFVRLKPGGDATMTAYLNPDHPIAAYHCGRLLAVLANLQRAALGDVGAGVVQRYYAAASQTPGLMLGRLVGNARNHLGKLEGGLAYWYENQIADVMSRLKDSAPRILDLEGQGLFALGYYQQLAALRAGNKNATSESITEHGEPK